MGQEEEMRDDEGTMNVRDLQKALAQYVFNLPVYREVDGVCEPVHGVSLYDGKIVIEG